MAQAITFDPKGTLYVGTSPDGKVYRVSTSGEKTVFFDPKTKYIWDLAFAPDGTLRSEEHTSELQSPCNLVCRLLLEKKKTCAPAGLAAAAIKATANNTPPIIFCRILTFSFLAVKSSVSLQQPSFPFSATAVHVLARR